MAVAAPPAPPAQGNHARGASGVAATTNRSDLFMFVLEDMDWEKQRPKHQWWRTLRPVFDQLSRRPGQE